MDQIHDYLQSTKSGFRSLISMSFECLSHLRIPTSTDSSGVLCWDKRNALLCHHLTEKHFDRRGHIQTKPRKSLACLCFYLLFNPHIDCCIHNILSIYTMRTVSSWSFSRHNFLTQ